MNWGYMKEHNIHQAWRREVYLNSLQGGYPAVAGVDRVHELAVGLEAVVDLVPQGRGVGFRGLILHLVKL